jgi:outer membrane protein assembly factor BamD
MILSGPSLRYLLPLNHIYMNGKLKISVTVGICIVALISFSGCAWFKSDEEVKSAEVLVQEGIKQFDRGDYKNALKSFEQLRDWYPFSKYVILAELKIGDAYYHREEYNDAIFAYEEFAELHPGNEAVPYVIYQIGRCYFDQMDTVDRDQSTTRKALDTFRQLQKQHPDSIYAERAVDHINKCLKNLAGNEFYIGLFYYKSKRYAAALNRFQAVVSKYPDVGIHRKAMQYIAKCESHLAKQAAP